MKKEKKDKGSVFGKGVVLPALGVGLGMYAGSAMGGTAARALANTPGLRQKLSRMTPAQKKKLLARVSYGTTAVGGVAGAGLGALIHDNVKKELAKKKGSSLQKTAMYLTCFDELRFSYE
jgi:hypothetical protein